MMLANTMQKRLIALQPNQTVILHTDVIRREFTIIGSDRPGARYFARGGSARCYDAKYYENEAWHYGKLKEIYTVDVTLTNEEETEPYIRAYRKLQKLISQDRSLNRLYTFVPRFEVYQSDEGRYYIWTDAVPMLTFEELYRKIWLGTERPEDALAQIITTIKALTDSIRILHTAGLIHGDINPTNFGFYVRDEKVLSDGLSLFDLDTLRNVGEAPGRYTELYYEPTANDENRMTYCDIRAIGVTLCAALGLSREHIAEIMAYNNPRRGQPQWGRIRKTVFSAAYFTLKGTPGNTDIQELLVQIIAGTVTSSYRRRIQSCTLLYRDLQRLETLLLPYSTRDTLSRGYALEIVDREARRKGQLRNVLQYHLYENPLYNYAEGIEGDYVIGVMGFGLDARQFLDVCLEAAQSLTERVRVVVWDGPELRLEKEQYLSERPSFRHFFRVDGDETQIPDHDDYGSVEFSVIRNGTAAERAKDAIRDLALRLGPEALTDVRYIYIASGSDANNREIAGVLASQYPRASVNAQCEYGQTRVEGRVRYLSVGDKPRDFSSAAEIERLAFNAHLLWTGSLNTDLEVKRKEFNDPYNHSACLSAVLGIKYRLHTLNIDMSVGDHDIAAAAFEAVQNTDPGTIDVLTAREHRRWVVEKVCSGWTPMSVEESLFFNDTKDKDEKRHTCLVRSAPAMALQDRNGRWHDLTLWDTADESDLNTLDELDRMSVQLHQAYKRRADSFIEGGLLDHRIQESVIEDLKDDRHVRRLFQEWYEILLDLFEKVNSGMGVSPAARASIRPYERAYRKLTAAMNGDAWRDNPKRDIVKNKLSVLYENFRPIIMYLRFHDYKVNDLDLIQHIPFILTYDDSASMVVMAEHETLAARWEEMQDPTELFNCVAAATVVNPRKLFLLYRTPTRPDPRDELVIPEKQMAFTEYMKRKGLQTEVIFKQCDDIARAVVDIAGMDGVTGRYLMIEVQVGNCLTNEEVETIYTSCKAGAFSFDARTRSFDPSPGIEWVNYIQRNASITSRDVATFLGRKAEAARQPFMRREDIDTLFGLYLGTPIAWKALCWNLERNRDEKVSELTRSGNSATRAETHRYILPYECFGASDAIVRLLKKQGYADAGSAVERYSMNECLVVLKGYTGCWRTMDDLFARPYFLMSTKEFSIGEEIAGTTVHYSVGADADPNKIRMYMLPIERWDDAQAVIDHLVERGYVSVTSHMEKTAYPDKCRVVIKGYTGEWENMKKLFAGNGSALSVDAHNPVWLYCDCLSKDGIVLKNRQGATAYGGLLTDLNALLSALHEKGFIRARQAANGTWKITYGSREIKNLLTKEGNILEYYTYFRTKDEPDYSDVVTSITFRWPSDMDAENEIDCFITKGMKTLLVECKAQNLREDDARSAGRLIQIKNAFADKIRKFGINGQGLLVIDSASIPKIPDPENMRTIHTQEDISNIKDIIDQLLI